MDWTPQDTLAALQQSLQTLQTSAATAASIYTVNDLDGTNRRWNERMWVLQNERNDKLYAQQLDDQRDYYDYQINTQRKLRDENRLYDSPEAQKQRLLSAGINPFMNESALGTGSSDAVGNPSASVPTNSTASPLPWNPRGTADLIMQGNAQLMQGNMMSSQINKQNAEAFSILLQNDYFQNMQGVKAYAEVLANNLTESTINAKNVETTNAIYNGILTKMTIVEKDMFLQLYPEERILQVANQAATFGNLILQGDLLKLEKDVKKWNIEKLKGEVKAVILSLFGIEADNNRKYWEAEEAFRNHVENSNTQSDRETIVHNEALSSGLDVTNKELGNEDLKTNVARNKLAKQTDEILIDYVADKAALETANLFMQYHLARQQYGKNTFSLGFNSTPTYFAPIKIPGQSGLSIGSNVPRRLQPSNINMLPR